MAGVICLVSGNSLCPDKFLQVVTQKIGLEVNADKTRYMVTSREQNAGRNNSMKTDNNSFERVEEVKNLGKTLTNQNYVQDEIKSRLKSGND